MFDSIVVQRSGPSGDLINLLDLDWDPVPTTNPGSAPLDPFAASDKVNQVNQANQGNQGNQGNQAPPSLATLAPPVAAGNPFGSSAFGDQSTVPPGMAAPARAASNNPFADDAPGHVPGMGISTVPLAHGGGAIPPGVFGVMPVVPGAAPGAPVQAGVAQGYAMGTPGQQGTNVNEVLATIPPPPGSAQAKPRDPLANLLG